MNRSYIAALAIFVAVVLLFTVGTLLNGDAASHDAEQSDTSHRFEVVVRTVEARMRPASLSLRGRTEAFREVVARAETGGRVAEAPIQEGMPVAAGDVLCRLDVDARSAAVLQAEADLRARQLDYEAAVELNRRGHRADNQVAAAEAVRDAARAQLSAAREELANVNIAAPFDGLFDGREAEIGDFLRTGEACGTVVQLDPILVVAEVGERHVADDQCGHSPVQETDHAIRSGITAEIRLSLPEEPAHRVPASILALNAEGVLGVRIVEEGNRVRFVPVELLSDDGEQVWVAGLPRRAEVIVLGQDFVADGVEVDVSREGAAR